MRRRRNRPLLRRYTGCPCDPGHPEGESAEDVLCEDLADQPFRREWPRLLLARSGIRTQQARSKKPASLQACDLVQFVEATVRAGMSGRCLMTSPDWGSGSQV